MSEADLWRVSFKRLVLWSMNRHDLNPADAEEIVQEAVRLFVASGGKADPADPRGLLHALGSKVNGIAVNRRRNKVNKATTLTTDGSPAEPDDPPPELEQAVIDKDWAGKHTMSIDLTLLPFTGDTLNQHDQPWSECPHPVWSAEALNTGGHFIWDAVQRLPQEPVPEDFQSNLTSTPPVDAYDRPLMFVRAGDLARAMAIREGIRRTRLAELRWAKLRLVQHGHRGVATVPGKPNKKPVKWALTEGTAEALRRWQRNCPSKVWVFPAEALPRYRRSRTGQPIYVQHFAADLRDALKKAGVDRPELFEPDQGFRRLVGHDLRATHVTLARANGVSDDVIRRRTRHTTTAMIDRYDHAVGLYEELECGLLVPLHEAIPELAEMEPSEQWVKAGLAEPSDDSIVGESSEDEAHGKKNR